MPRVAGKPITLPNGVSFTVTGVELTVKGSKGSIQMKLHNDVQLTEESGTIKVTLKGNPKLLGAIAGTTRAIVQNMVTGVSAGFEKKLVLVGVGYRAAAQGKTLKLSLGHSHPIEYVAPEDISIEAPSQTDIIVKGIDKQLVGQVAADIRAFRPPEPYKGKGVRYHNETIILKEGKKK